MIKFIILPLKGRLGLRAPEQSEPDLKAEENSVEPEPLTAAHLQLSCLKLDGVPKALFSSSPARLGGGQSPALGEAPVLVAGKNRSGRGHGQGQGGAGVSLLASRSWSLSSLIKMGRGSSCCGSFG